MFTELFSTGSLCLCLGVLECLASGTLQLAGQGLPLNLS